MRNKKIVSEKSFKAFFALISLLASAPIFAAQLNFSEAYTGTITTSREESNAINALVDLGASVYTIKSLPNRAATAFTDNAGNNVEVELIYTVGATTYTIPGVVSRQEKSGSTVRAFYFYSYGNDSVINGDVGEKGYLLVRNTYKNDFSPGQNVGTSSDFKASSLNDAAQEDAVVLSVSDATAPEGSRLSHTVNLAASPISSKTFYLRIIFGSASVSNAAATDVGTTLTFSNGVTYNASTYVLTVPAGVASFTVSVAALNDSLTEQDETYSLRVGASSSSYVQGAGTITDVSAPATATLTLDKDATTSVLANGSITYTFSIGNSGAANYSGSTVTLIDKLPTAVLANLTGTPIRGISSVGCSGSSGTLTCTVNLNAPIPAFTAADSNTAPSFTLSATAPSNAGSITNYASVDSTGGSSPPNPVSGCSTSNCASSSTVVETPVSLTLSKSATSTVLTSGSITYTLTVTNTGTTVSGTSISLKDQLPSNVVATAIGGFTGKASTADCGVPPNSSAGALLSCHADLVRWAGPE